MSNLSNVLTKNPGKWTNRLLIGTPMTGLVRSEWAFARFGQTIPTNWSHVDVIQWMQSNIPLRFQVPDAENLIAKACVEGNFEWLLFIESDNILPHNTFIKLNQYMIRGDVPIVGALYFTKSHPPEPMIYREFGKGYYADWKLGDKVWAKGLPFGCTLIHGSIIRELWKDAPEYVVGNQVTRRVFSTPSSVLEDPETNDYMLTSGTSDLNFCKQIVDNKIFERAGWGKYQKKEFPFLVDTNIFVKHIDNEGIQYPVDLSPEFLAKKRTFKEEIKRWN
jgi:hypothetical protein